MTLVKICRITNLGDAIAAVEAGADYIGFVCSESPRRAGYSEVVSIGSTLDGKCNLVGVYAGVDDLLAFDAHCDIELDYFQVYFSHEHLSVHRPRKGWIDAVMVNGTTLTLPQKREGIQLIDFKKSSADRVDELLGPISRDVSVNCFIAGNLTIGNVSSIIHQYRPFGVDCARGTESTPGKKDLLLLKEFIRKAKDASTG